MSWWKYDEQLGTLHEGLTKSSVDVGNLVRFLLNPLRFSPSNSAAWMISFFGSLPVVDYYEAVIATMQKLIATGTNLDSTAKEICELTEAVGIDERLNVMCSVLGVKPRTVILGSYQKLAEALDLYTAGSYEKSVACAKEIIEDDPNSFQCYELAAKANARSGNKNPTSIGNREIDSILENLHNVLCKNSDAERSASNLTKAAYTLAKSSFAAELFSFVVREHVTDGLENPMETTYGLLNGRYFNPKNAFSIIQPKCRQQYLNMLREISSCDRLIDFIEAIASINTGIVGMSWVAPERLAYYTARRSVTIKDYQTAEKSLKSILAGTDPVLEQDAVLLLGHAFRKQSKYLECVELFANAYVKNIYIEPRLPIAELIDEIDAHGISCETSIAHPILRGIIARMGGNRQIHKRDDAYEDFLEAHEITRPTQLNEIRDRFNIDLLITFLRDVCLPQVMDSSVAFESTEELLSERIGVCRMLIECDPDHVEVYSEEIKKITQYLVVQKGITEVEQSKIYVDALGIAHAIEKSLKDSYARYVDLVATDHNAGAEKLILKLHEILGEEVVVIVPRDELSALLYEMVAEVRDEFVSSSEFGLDGYLSTGLRHGTLAGQIRSPFETENLVTQRDETSMVYKEPTYWLEQLKLSRADKDTLTNSLTEFSRSLDAIIDEVRGEWVQITTEKKHGLGMFDYRLAPKRLRALQAKLRDGASYKRFLELVFEMLWEITEKNLSDIRARIENELTERIVSLLDEVGIRASQIGGDTARLQGAITRARTNAQYSLDRIASWFKRAKASDLGPCDLDLPLEIAIAMIKNVFPAFQFDCVRNVFSGRKLAGSARPNLVNLFYLLFENVRKHCSSEAGVVIVLANIEVVEEVLRITMSNRIREELDVEMARERLEDALARVEGSFDYVNKEEGSGILKMKKILIVELGLNPKMRFFISDTRDFEVEIKFAAENILV